MLRTFWLSKNNDLNNCYLHFYNNNNNNKDFAITQGTTAEWTVDLKYIFKYMIKLTLMPCTIF